MYASAFRLGCWLGKALAATAFRSPGKGSCLVGATGIEPVTSAVSRHGPRVLSLPREPLQRRRFFVRCMDCRPIRVQKSRPTKWNESRRNETGNRTGIGQELDRKLWTIGASWGSHSLQCSATMSESECDSGEEPDLGVGGFDESL
jgi:hypothetical protein